MNYEIKENRLLIKGKELFFEYPIKGVLEKEGVLMVLLKVPAKFNYQRNIFGANEEGEIIWQVEAPSDFKEDLFTSLGINNEDNVEAYSWKGCENIIDPKTGKILKQEFVRF
jgi:hypothetical protein